MHLSFAFCVMHLSYCPLIYHCQLTNSTDIYVTQYCTRSGLRLIYLHAGDRQAPSVCNRRAELCEVTEQIRLHSL